MEPFFKYHGLGNDFVVIDRRRSGRDVEAAEAIRLCDRHRGIGADGVLALLEAPGSSGATIPRMVVHNADGSIAEMCGNGLRCVAKYLAERDEKHPSAITIATGAGPLLTELSWSGAEVAFVTVQMGPARLSAANLPPGGSWKHDGIVGTPVNMGNPHLVLLDTPPNRASALGASLEHAKGFPERTNVEFCAPRMIDGKPAGLEVTVWERGVGITQACGTGACAAVVAHAQAGRVPFGEWVSVALPGGVLDVEVARDLSQVRMRGPATFVYQGNLDEKRVP